MPGRRITLAHLTLNDLTLVQMAPVAAAAGYSSINIRMWRLADHEGTILSHHPQRLKEAMRRFADVGLAPYDVTAVVIEEGFSLDEYRAGLEMSAEIGARRVLALCRDEDLARGADNFAAVAQAAAPLGLSLDLEFMRFCPVKSLNDAVRFVAHCGQDNVGVVMDTTHFFRSGGGVEDIARTDPKYLAWMQIADGPREVADPMEEGRSERMLPGEGVFPLVEIVRAMPADAVVSVEVPSRRRIEAGVGPAEWAATTMAATRRVLDAAAR